MVGEGASHGTRGRVRYPFNGIVPAQGSHPASFIPPWVSPTAIQVEPLRGLKHGGSVTMVHKFVHNFELRPRLQWGIGLGLAKPVQELWPQMPAGIRKGSGSGFASGVWLGS